MALKMFNKIGAKKGQKDKVVDNSVGKGIKAKANRPEGP